MDNVAYQSPLTPVSSRFALSRALMSASDEPVSGPATRPFGLRFAQPAKAVGTALPPHRYCHARQINVEMATGSPLFETAMEPTTIGSKDGKENPQEDWKPDL